MNIADSLRAISLYPINPLTIENICEECGLLAGDRADAEVRDSREYKRAKAKVFLYLAEAPQVTEAGASFSFTDDERQAFRGKAARILDEIGDEDSGDSVACGWIAEDL